MTFLLMGLAVAGCLYWITAAILTWDFFRGPSPPRGDFTPPVSVLKPLKGLDAGLYENFTAVCRQDYPAYEIVFGVGDPDDPAAAVVRRLAREFPEIRIRLLVAAPGTTNQKIGLLRALAAAARHELLVVSDSDVRVGPDYLRRVVAQMADPDVGLVTCVYRGTAPVTLTARLEALYIGTAFLPAIMVARHFLNMRFAMGSTVVVSQTDLSRIGGFAALGDYLADDYEIGVRIALLGRKVHLSDYVTDIILGSTTFRDQWDREVRWLQCARVSRPLEFPGLLLTFAVPFAVLALAADGFGPAGWLVFGSALTIRWTTAWLITAWTANKALRRWLPLLPIRDMLTAVVWSVASFGKRVVWRGQAYFLTSDGRLLRPPPTPALNGRPRRWPNPARGLIRALDALLRRLLALHDLGEDGQGLFRLRLGQAKRDVVLSDRTRIARGEPVGELHFWNENIPPIGGDGPGLRWALTFERLALRSLQQLAACVDEDPDLRAVRAFRGESSFLARYEPARVRTLLRRWGFDVVSLGEPRTAAERIALFWKHLYGLGLLWAFNPGSLKDGRLPPRRWDEVWISRRELIDLYGRREHGGHGG
jgi:ceramide glucosyltransferase